MASFSDNLARARPSPPDDVPVSPPRRAGDGDALDAFASELDLFVSELDGPAAASAVAAELTPVAPEPAPLVEAGPISDLDLDAAARPFLMAESPSAAAPVFDVLQAPEAAPDLPVFDDPVSDVPEPGSSEAGAPEIVTGVAHATDVVPAIEILPVTGPLPAVAPPMSVQRVDAAPPLERDPTSAEHVEEPDEITATVPMVARVEATPSTFRPPRLVLVAAAAAIVIAVAAFAGVVVALDRADNALLQRAFGGSSRIEYVHAGMSAPLPGPASAQAFGPAPLVTPLPPRPRPQEPAAANGTVRPTAAPADATGLAPAEAFGFRDGVPGDAVVTAQGQGAPPSAVESASSASGDAAPRRLDGVGSAMTLATLGGRAAGGRLVLLLDVSEQGGVTNVGVEMVEGVDSGVVAAAQAAARTWRYEPARRAGTPVPARVRVEVQLAGAPRD